MKDNSQNRNFFTTKEHFNVKSTAYSLVLMRRSNCSAPIPPPPGTPGDINFLGVAPGSLSIYFCLAPPPCANTLISLFSSAPPFFITHILPLTPGLP